MDQQTTSESLDCSLDTVVPWEGAVGREPLEESRWKRAVGHLIALVGAPTLLLLLLV